MSEPEVELLTKEEVLSHISGGGAVEEPGNSTGNLHANGSKEYVHVNCTGGCCDSDYDSFEEFWHTYGRHKWQVADWW